MSKILTIAWNEYKTVVFTKSFLIGLLLPPIFYGGMIVLMLFVEGTGDRDERRLIVADHTGVVLPAFEEAVVRYNRSDAVYDQSGKQVGPPFAVEAYAGEQEDLAALELELSDRVRAGEAFAFVVIGEQYATLEGGPQDFLYYYSNAPTAREMPMWVRQTVQEAVEGHRLTEAGLEERRVRQIFSHNAMERFNLAELSATGEVIKPLKESTELSVFVPMVAALMLFFGIQMAMPVLLNSVVEEKMQRIAEVLLSSVTPYQLLWGKLLAGSAVGLSFSLAYLATGAIALVQMGRGDYVSASFLLFFFLFLLVSLLTFGSLLAAISASCQDLKDSQNMAGAVVVLILVPLVLAVGVVFSPDSNFAQTMSLIPPFSPMMMTVRLAVPPGPPLWQPVLTLVLNLGFAFLVVWAAGRIFRIGILAQGKTPSWRQLMRWALRG